MTGDNIKIGELWLLCGQCGYQGLKSGHEDHPNPEAATYTQTVTYDTERVPIRGQEV